MRPPSPPRGKAAGLPRANQAYWLRSGRAPASPADDQALQKWFRLPTREVCMKKVIAGLAVLALGSVSASAQAKDVTLGVSLASDTNPFYIAMRRGIDGRATDLGWKVRYVT